MVEKELQLVSKLTGIAPEKITFSNNGFLSRGYIIEGGHIVFKFKKWPEISYQNEAKALDYINALNLNVKIQKVNWRSENDDYLGVYGVVGKSLEDIETPKEQYENYGQQIGAFLKTLHSASPKDAETLTIEQEISIWQKKYERSKDIIKEYFTDQDIEKMDSFIYSELPTKLRALGDRMVFSHGDIRLANIFVDETNNIGIIDFSEAAYQDEAADFMDLEDDTLREEILKVYEADDVLRQKVTLRRIVHPMFIIGTYRDRPKEEMLRYITALNKSLKALLNQSA